MCCSVCARSDNSMLGGVLLWERNGAISSICTDCWVNFSCVSEHERTFVNRAQEEAYKANIGVESQLYHKVLPQKKKFVDNLAEAKFQLKIKEFQKNPTKTSDSPSARTDSISKLRVSLDLYKSVE
eukprot:TRINITY_DN35166_c0_g1_i1.p1 TRINITY_DN35166_c0_g1~~TRINITY_DN35166_c0_g1_i1.p1  ORF type:complete len:126 (+),score=0.13 TRINITY_DN35166_c0_g1_i1:321-698(+)